VAVGVRVGAVVRVVVGVLVGVRGGVLVGVAVGVEVGIVPAQSVPHADPPTKLQVQLVPQVGHAGPPSDVSTQVITPEQFDVQQPAANAARGVSAQPSTKAAAQPRYNSTASQVRVCFTC